MDQARVEQHSAKAIEPELNNLKDVKTRDYFTPLMGRTTTDFEFSLFTVMIYADLKDPHRFFANRVGLFRRILSDPGRNRSARSRLLFETGICGPKDRLSNVS
jgi:hypothetical protein